jgi:mitochondrial fission protein ELM1
LGSTRCAILRPPAKRIEKKLSVIRSENFSGTGKSASGPAITAPGDAASLIAASRKARADKTWILTDGSVGMEAQGIAVAEAVGLPFSLKRVRVTGAMQFVPTRLQIYLPPTRLLRSVSANKPLQAPWPRLVISIGRRSVPIALAVKKLSGAFALHIQNPKVPPRLFDLIAAPVHDDFRASNVIPTFGAVHSVTAERLAEEKMRFAPQVQSLPHPRIAVLLGGESQAFSFPPDAASSFGAKLANLARDTGGSLLVTPSRRTRKESIAALETAIEEVPHIVWDGVGDNPYFGFLALADAIIVTEDSVNMVTEAAGTGKPVYVQPLPGRSNRLSRFHRLMRDRGATRPFEGKLERWTYPPINDTELVASAIRSALGLETKG